MIAISDFEQTALDRFEDAKCLLENSRFDGAVYLAGYAIEIALKVRLCKENGFTEFPGKHDKIYHKWFSHNLAKLEELSNLNLTTNYLAEWSVIQRWTVELRYKQNTQAQQSSEVFINCVDILLPVILAQGEKS
jgi:hypothetical protein